MTRPRELFLKLWLEDLSQALADVKAHKPYARLDRELVAGDIHDRHRKAVLFCSCGWVQSFGPDGHESFYDHIVRREGMNSAADIQVVADEARAHEDAALSGSLPDAERACNHFPGQTDCEWCR